MLMICCVLLRPLPISATKDSSNLPLTLHDFPALISESFVCFLKSVCWCIRSIPTFVPKSRLKYPGNGGEGARVLSPGNRCQSSEPSDLERQPIEFFVKGDEG